MLYDLLFHRKTMALVLARPAGAPWSAIERRDDPAAPFVLRLGVELDDGQLAAMYPPPPAEEPEPVAEEVEPVAEKAKKPAKPKKKGA